MLADLRLALRALRRAPAFTAIAAFCLALGIGANTTVFSVVNGLLIRPLPFRDAERVMSVRGVDASGESGQSFSYPDYRDHGDMAGTMTLAAYTDRSANLGGVDVPERVEVARVTASLFPTLGLPPQLGRQIRPDEEMDGRVVLLSDLIWRRRFAADPRVVGRSVLINGEPHTVIGVMGRDVRFPESSEMWLPLRPDEAREERTWRQYQVIGRLRDGVPMARADAAARTISARIAAQHPASNLGLSSRVEPFRADLEREVGPMMRIFLGVVGFVLLIACANVANMLLARATARRREIAVRLALGASRWRIVRQLLAESVVLAAIGGALGALLGAWALSAIVSALPSFLPYWMTFEVDGRVLTYTALAALGSAAVFGLVPAIQAARPELVESLKEGGARGGGTGRRAKRARAALVVGQLALSLVLLAGAGLMMRSFLAMQHADLGFAPSGVLTFETSLQGDRYAGPAGASRGYDDLLSRLRALPGVTAVGATSQLPGSCCSSTAIYPEGTTYTPATAPSPLYLVVTPGLFDALGMRVVAGRGIGPQDRGGTPRVAVVNETLARRLWGDASPLGRRYRNGVDDTTWVTVVGVVRDVQQRLATDRPRPALYVANAQAPLRSMSVALRTAGDPALLAPAMRGAVRGFDRDVPVSSLQSMNNKLYERNFQPRIYSGMFAVFAAAALVLAGVGLYGVVAYGVVQRTHEIGVRVALGAGPDDVRRLVLGEGGRLVLIGLAIGVPASFALARVLRGALYGVGAGDPVTFVLVPAVLAAVALLATWIPARRAARLEPVAALRSE